MPLIIKIYLTTKKIYHTLSHLLINSKRMTLNEEPQAYDRQELINQGKAKRTEIETALRNQLESTQQGIDKALAIEFLDSYGITVGSKQPEQLEEQELRDLVRVFIKRVI
jgi:hydroxymethylpyrimidine pyrophosphatase-like HAD family hydrolase